MDERTRRISDLLHEAGEVHHVVYRITDGADDDWASFYADWLIDHSELSNALGRTPIRSRLGHELVECERAFAEAPPAGRCRTSTPTESSTGSADAPTARPGRPDTTRRHPATACRATEQ